MGQDGWISGIKSGFGAGSFVRDALGTNLTEVRDMLRSGYSRAGWKGAYEAAGTFFGRNVATSGPGSMNQVRRALGPTGYKIAHAAGGDMANTARGMLATRQLAGVGTIGAAAMGVSMMTGVSVFDQAQALGAGYMGYKGAQRLNLFGQGGGKFGKGVGIGLGVAMTAGAGVTGGALGGWSWTLGAAGYGSVRGAQAIAGRKGGQFLGRHGAGGGVGRVLGAAAGIGLGMLI